MKINRRTKRLLQIDLGSNNNCSKMEKTLVLSTISAHYLHDCCCSWNSWILSYTTGIFSLRSLCAYVMVYFNVYNSWCYGIEFVAKVIFIMILITKFSNCGNEIWFLSLVHALCHHWAMCKYRKERENTSLKQCYTFPTICWLNRKFFSPRRFCLFQFFHS